MDISKQIKKSLGLEDDAPQVEINFNVDTDDNGAPLSPVDQDGDQNVEDAKADAIEAEAEVNKVETEQEELEEAQEALESLKVVLDKASMTGGLSPIAMEMFKIAMTRVTGSKELVEQVTMESAFTSPVQRQLEAAKLVEVSLESLETVSMEGVKEVWAKIKESVLKFFNLEESVMKRANALLELAKTREGEHSTSKTIPVNVKRGLKSTYLAHTQYNYEKEIVTQFDRMKRFYDSIKVPSLDKSVDMSDAVRTIFNLKDSEWSKEKDLVLGAYMGYKFFNVEVQRSSFIYTPLDKTNKSVNSLPVLRVSTATKMLKDIIDMGSNRGVLEQVVEELDVPSTVLINSNGTNSTVSDLSTAKLQELSHSIHKLIKHRVKLLDELVNYCGMCIQDRGVDSPSSND